MRTQGATQLAQHLMQQGNLDDAARILERALADFPHDPEVLRQLAQLHQIQGRSSEVIRPLRQAALIEVGGLQPQVHTPPDQSAGVKNPEHLQDDPDDDDLSLILATAKQAESQRDYFQIDGDSDKDSSCPARRRLSIVRTASSKIRDAIQAGLGLLFSRTEHGDGQDKQVTVEVIPTTPPRDEATGLTPAAKQYHKTDILKTDAEGVDTPRSAPIQPLENPDKGSSIQPSKTEELRLVTSKTPEPAPISISTSEQPFLQTSLFDLLAEERDSLDSFSTDEAQLQFEEGLDEEEIFEILQDEDLEDDLLAVEEFNEAEFSGYDWDELAQEAEEFEELPTRDELIAEVRASGRLSHSERAEQVAIELGQRYGWEKDGIALLTEVFNRYWWSRAKVSMERELEAGMTPDELELALACRDLWHERPEFAINLAYVYDGYGAGQASATYINLSWPMALRLVRAFGARPDLAEIMQFLDDLYDHWYTSPRLCRIFKSFNLYLYHRLGMLRETLRIWPEWDFGAADDPCYRDEELEEVGRSRRNYQWLDWHGLIPCQHADGLRDQLRHDPNSPEMQEIRDYPEGIEATLQDNKDARSPKKSTIPRQRINRPHSESANMRAEPTSPQSLDDYL